MMMMMMMMMMIIKYRNKEICLLLVVVGAYLLPMPTKDSACLKLEKFALLSTPSI
jgi:hypothetical protein